MVKQFDIITVDLDPTRGKEKQKYRPCVVVSNNLVNNSTSFSWIFPITSRNKVRPTDIILKTKNNKVKGIIDTVQIRCIDISVRNCKVVDVLDDELKSDLLVTIAAHTEII
ncbi:growth inhibitor PemK [Staphylococcus sp. MB371]|uniref:type II toxin-antitoxin system PemK/MazF family toxin n=1 Tax=Mammaliicoccus sciuri TaxID=1296 RepID=UPI00099340B4|nr:type II toxin-antitoxin system PemK/MazF family toxin [Mammaliicoccus sciuri]OOV39553.1 growth inhibitor PemK [Staphylococcus sp. MB371]